MVAPLSALHASVSEMVLDLMPTKLFFGDFTHGLLPDGPESREEVILVDGELHHVFFCRL